MCKEKHNTDISEGENGCVNRRVCSEVKGHEFGWLYVRGTKAASKVNQVVHTHTLSNTHTHTYTFFTLLLLLVTYHSCSRLNNELCETDKVTKEGR